MGAKTKRAQKVRAASEFPLSSLKQAMTPPVEPGNVYSWSLADIMSARDAQIRGDFARPARLAVSMRTNDAMGVARRNRLAPQRCIKVEIVPAKGARGVSVAGECEALYGQDGIAVSPGTKADINGCLVDHGVAFAYNTWTPREDGTRVDVEVRFWPISAVRWDAYKRCYVTRVDPTIGAAEVEIHHGDGRWIIFAAHDFEPHNQDAAVLDGCLVWATHALAKRDWAKGSVAHGSAKVVGEMPEGVALQSATGGLTPEAAAFAELLKAIATSDTACGIRPAGSKTEFVTNTSTAWQVWVQLVENAERAAARIYLGTDGILGSVGGAPGVDISQLFGVATTKVQGDLTAISRGLQTGSIEIWTAINFDGSELAPTHRYMLPDADQDADRASYKQRYDDFFAHIESAAERFEIDQDYVDDVAKAFDVDPPTLKVVPPAAAAVVPPAENPPAAAPALRAV